MIRCVAAASLAFIIGVLTSSCGGCAGYQIGHRSLYRPDIRTIYVPIFQSDSLRRNLGERLTEAVVKEIETNTSYKVVADENADSVLTGRILTDKKRVIAENINDEPRDLEVDFVVQISWQDQRGDMIMQTGIPLPPVVSSLTNSVHFIPEGGQSLATAQQRSIQRLAEQIVSQLQSPW